MTTSVIRLRPTRSVVPGLGGIVAQLGLDLAVGGHGGGGSAMREILGSPAFCYASTNFTVVSPGAYDIMTASTAVDPAGISYCKRSAEK